MATVHKLDTAGRPDHAPPRLSVLVADDHPRHRATLTRGLEAHGLDVIACVGDASAAVKAAVASSPDVCLLDIHMPGNGLLAAERITELLPETPVIMLTVSEDADDLFNALRAGARGYLNKSADTAELAANVRRVVEGETFVPQRVLHRVLEELSPPKPRRLFQRRHAEAALSPRQDEILRRLAGNETPATVADDLGLDVAVIHAELAVALHALRVRSADELSILLDRD